MLALLALPLLVLQALDAGEGRGTPQLAALAIPSDTVVGADGLPAWTPAFANPSATLERRYRLRGQPVGLFVGYYIGRGSASKLVSSANAWVRSGDPFWVVAESGSRNVEMGARDLVVRTARLRRPVSSSDDTMLAVRQIYWVNGRFEASDVRAKALGAWYRLLGRGDDGAVVIVYAAEQRPGDADALLDAILRDHLAAIDLQLRKARDGD